MTDPAPVGPDGFASPEQVAAALEGDGYLADDGLAMALYLAMSMNRPLLLEGEAGVGKTEAARAIARVTGGRLVRLQCYEGIDVSGAVYEWDHARQLMHLRAAEATGELAGGADAVEAGLYSERFLLRRPLLEAISAAVGPPPVLLIDEVDRADDEFEAFLLEVLSDWSVTVPELGTITARVVPIAILTSNRTRDLHDALKRRCLYHWLEHPDLDREAAIVARRVPEAGADLARQVAALVEQLRTIGLYKPPGVAETIDWTTALVTLGRGVVPETVGATLGTVLKYREDQERARAAGLDELVSQARRRAV